MSQATVYINDSHDMKVSTGSLLSIQTTLGFGITEITIHAYTTDVPTAVRMIAPTLSYIILKNYVSRQRQMKVVVL